MNTDEILAALRQVQEALRSCEYTKSSWDGGSSEFDDSLGHLRGDDVRKVLAHYKAAVRG